jgi:hypothetical protein
MEDKQITEQESLLLIQQMIQTAKAEQKDDGKGWIVWGWVLFTASVLTYLNIELQWSADTYIFWNLFGLVTIVFFVYESIRYFFFKKTQRVKTYTSDLFARLNTGFFLTLMLIIVATNVGITPQKGFSLLVGLYAFWVLIYGTALNFRPSIVASYIMWGIAFVCLFIDDFRWIMLLHALAVLCGYIIPGHMANRAFKRVSPAPYK